MSEIWIMYRKLFISIVLLFNSFYYFSQEPILLLNPPKVFFTKEIGYSLRMPGAFHGLSIIKPFSRYDIGIGFGIGIKNTYFQNCFTPIFKIECAYNLMKKENSEMKQNYYFGPLLQLNYSFQRIISLHNYSTALLGYKILYGEKIRFYHSLCFGPFLETFIGEKNKRLFASTWTGNLTFGLTYALY